MDESDLVFICVGTPSRPDGKADMSAMLEVAQAAAPHVKHPHTFINKSTVPMGSGRWLRSVIEDAGGGPRVAELVRVASNPEFLREGTAVSDYLHPDRVVVGADDTAALDDIVELYQPVLDQSFPGSDQRGPVPLVKTDLMTAEMIKYAANAFLATKISFANEMARFCDLVGADIQTVTAGVGLDQRIGPRFLNAGLGWGGSCFTKDVLAMVTTAADYGYQARLLEATLAINNDQRHLVVERLLRHLKNLRGARIALLGLSYKPGTDDVRDSPALDIATQVIEYGAFVSAYDPVVKALPGGRPCASRPTPTPPPREPTPSWSPPNGPSSSTWTLPACARPRKASCSSTGATACRPRSSAPPVSSTRAWAAAYPGTAGKLAIDLTA